MIVEGSSLAKTTDYSHPIEYKMVLTVILVCTFLMPNDVELFLICHSTSCFNEMSNSVTF